MDAIEIVATSEPLNAKSLWLYTMANEQEEQTRQWELRANQPKVCATMMIQSVADIRG
jgi:hypothetical protein